MHASAFISRANGGIRPPGATPTARIIYTNSFPFSPHPPTTPYNHPCSVADTPEGVLARRGRCWWRRDDAGLHHRGLREWPTPGDKWGRTGCRTVPVLPAAVRAPGVLAQHAMGWTWMVSPVSCPTGFFRWHWRRWQTDVPEDYCPATKAAIRRTPSRPPSRAAEFENKNHRAGR
jgi:hypothetical protein